LFSGSAARAWRDGGHELLPAAVADALATAQARVWVMSMDVEEMIRAQPMDAVVLVGGCDKTVPAQLMGAASADLPTIQLVDLRRRRTKTTAPFWRFRRFFR
jgi:hypothetical protein